MADSMMDRGARVRSLLTAGSGESIPEADLRAEVAWRQSAQLIRTDALDSETASCAQLLAALQGQKIPPASEPQAEPAAEPTTTSRKGK